MKRQRIIVIALLAAAAFAACAAGASGNKLSISSQRMTVKWSALRFTGLGGIISITCPVTLEGSFHSTTISKVRGSLSGVVTSGRLAAASCSGGTAILLNGIERLPGGTTAPNTLPWHKVFDSFTGTLPRITGIRTSLVGVGFLLNVSILGSTVSCLYLTTVARPAFGIAVLEGGRVTGMRADETSTIPAAAGQPGACPASANFSGTGTVSALTVRLI